MLSNIRYVTFWGFDGSTLSHGVGLLVLFKLKVNVNENVASLLSISYMPEADRSQIKVKKNKTGKRFSAI